LVESRLLVDDALWERKEVEEGDDEKREGMAKRVMDCRKVVAGSSSEALLTVFRRAKNLGEVLMGEMGAETLVVRGA
jgi:hypothetical protein